MFFSIQNIDGLLSIILNISYFHIESTNHDGEEMKKLAIFAIIVSSIVILLFIWAMSVLAYFKCQIKREEEQKRKKQNSTKEIIHKIITFEEAQNIYSIQACAIWLVNYSRDSKVVLIDTCRHIFHSEWLCNFQSMESLSNSIKSKCPIWKTELNAQTNII